MEKLFPKTAKKTVQKITKGYFKFSFVNGDMKGNGNKIEVNLQLLLPLKKYQIQMPKEGDTSYFKNNTRKFEAPFIMYADFECLTMEYKF